MKCSAPAELYLMAKHSDGVWAARYRCVPCKSGWEKRLVEWSPFEMATWYRDNVLSREGLAKSAETPMPWSSK